MSNACLIIVKLLISTSSTCFAFAFSPTSVLSFASSKVVNSLYLLNFPLIPKQAVQVHVSTMRSVSSFSRPPQFAHRFWSARRHLLPAPNALRLAHRPLAAKAMSASTLPPTVFQGGSLFTEDGGFDDRAAEHFLATYWQKHPVLFRAAFKFESPISPDELAGLVSAPAHVPPRAHARTPGAHTGDGAPVTQIPAL